MPWMQSEYYLWCLSWWVYLSVLWLCSAGRWFINGHETHSNNSDDRLRNMRGSGQTSLLYYWTMDCRQKLVCLIKIIMENRSTANAERIACVRKLHARLKASSEERRIARVLSVIEKVCSKLLLPRSLSETAAQNIQDNFCLKIILKACQWMVML